VRGFFFPELQFGTGTYWRSGRCAPPNDRIQVSSVVVLRLSGKTAPPKNEPRPAGRLRANHHKIQAFGMALASVTKSLLRELSY
jgi:hypothetical protein